MVAWIVIGLLRVARCRMRVTGIEHLPRSGGAVIAWNHHSHVDFLLTAFHVYVRLGRPVRFLAMRELWGHRWLGWVPRFADAIPVTRVEDGDRERALVDAVEALRAGHLVMVAPEAGISRSFELGRFRTGAARMARDAGVPLVPSVSWGSHRFSTTGRSPSLRSALRLPVDVAFGEPLSLGHDDDPLEATLRLRERMGRMLDTVQRGYAGGAPAGAWWVPARLGGGAPPSDPGRRAPRSRPGDGG